MDSHGLYRRKDSPYWWCNVYDSHGRRTPKSTKCTDKRAAAKRKQALEQEAQGLCGHDAAYPIKDAVMDFLERGLRDIAAPTALMYRQKAGHLVRVLGEKDAGRITHDDVAAYVAQREDDEGAHPHTVQKELVTLRRVFRLAEQRQAPVADWRKFMPEHSGKYKPRDRWLTEAEYVQLLRAVQPHRAEWIRLAVYSGGRKGELDRLNWSDVDLAAGVIHMPGTKTEGSRRDVPIEAPLRRMLERTTRRRGLVVKRWLQVDRDLGRACKRVGIERVTCNDLRRTFASWLLQRGVEPMTVAKLLGHSSLAMVHRVYGRLSQANLSAAVSRLPDPEIAAK